MLDLRTCAFGLDKRPKSSPNVDVFVVVNDGRSGVVTIGVPPGRDDVAEFVVRCLIAGQKVLRQLPPDSPFAPDQNTFIIDGSGTAKQ